MRALAKGVGCMWLIRRHSEDVICFGLLILILSALVVFYAVKQPRISAGAGRGDDGVVYAAVAEAFSQDEKAYGSAPFVYRIGVPLAVTAMSRVFDTTIDDSFLYLNIACVYAVVATIYVLARHFLSPLLSLLTCVVFILPFHAPPRFCFFYPVYVDPPWLFLVYLSMVLLERYNPSSKCYVLLISAATFLATLVRETGLLIPLTLFLSTYAVRQYLSIELFLGLPVRPSRLDRDAGPRQALLNCALLFGTAIVAILLTRLTAQSTIPYAFLDAAVMSLSRQSLLYYTQAMFVAFGPLLALILVRPGAVIRHFGENPHHLVFTVLVIVLSLVGGVNTVRFLYWCSPLVFILVFKNLETMTSDLLALRSKRRRHLGLLLLGMLFVMQVLNAHPFEGFYSDYQMWKEWGGLQFVSPRPLLVFCYVSTLVATVLAFRWIGLYGRAEPTQTRSKANGR
ncbi:MAG: hypothetical protein ACUVXG_14355 [Anaerolineae bacterium]